jgi:hypothetical protein
LDSCGWGNNFIIALMLEVYHEWNVGNNQSRRNHFHDNKCGGIPH